MFYQLDVATALSETGAGQYNVPVSEVYWNNPNAFGGWISAIAIEAVLAILNFVTIFARLIYAAWPESAMVRLIFERP